MILDSLHAEDRSLNRCQQLLSAANSKRGVGTQAVPAPKMLVSQRIKQKRASSKMWLSPSRAESQ